MYHGCYKGTLSHLDKLKDIEKESLKITQNSTIVAQSRLMWLLLLPPRPSDVNNICFFTLAYLLSVLTLTVSTIVVPAALLKPGRKVTHPPTAFLDHGIILICQTKQICVAALTPGADD